MVYLAIKELANSAENMIMVTSSIMKDIQPNLEVIYRPNAIRALCRVIDVSELLQAFVLPHFCGNEISAHMFGFNIGFNDARGGKILQDRDC